MSINNPANPLKAASQSSSSGGEVYSTEETRIGTWIDGKPLYRKGAYQRIDPINGWTNISNSVIDDIETVVSLIGTSFVISKGGVLSIPYSDGSSFISARYQNAYNPSFPKGIDVFYNQSAAAVGTCDITIVIEYTKTTD